MLHIWILAFSIPIWECSLIWQCYFYWVGLLAFDFACVCLSHGFPFHLWIALFVAKMSLEQIVKSVKHRNGKCTTSTDYRWVQWWHIQLAWYNLQRHFQLFGVVPWSGWMYNAQLQKHRGASVSPQWESCTTVTLYFWKLMFCLVKARQAFILPGFLPHQAT